MNARRYSKQPLFSLVLSLIMILSLMLPQARPQLALAQGGDGLRREANAASGRLNFIASEGGRPLPALQALGKSLRPQDPALELARHYGPEFGLKDPGRELAELRKSQAKDGRLTVRYQQRYQDIPVMGGELIVNTDGNGDLYSINGEISPDLSLPTQASIDPEQARQAALESMAKWYGKTPEDFVAMPPELWIYDESLLQPSTRPVELTWRMEVTARDNSLPVRELVLVNAQRGSISLHFNQIDTAWTSPSVQPGGAIQSAAPMLRTSSTENLPPIELLRSTGIPSDGTRSLNDPSFTAAATTWYVTTTGNNSNSCTTTGSPCLTINGAIGKAATEDIIKVAVGNYYEQVSISKNLTLSGGWNALFTTQNDRSIIDGQNIRQGIVLDPIIATIERFIVQNGNNGPGVQIDNAGTLTINNSIIRANMGGIRSYGTLVLNNSAVSNNTGPTGAGIENYGTLTLNNSLVNGNVSSLGGGIYSNGSITINNSSISGNSASTTPGRDGSGGGIYSFSGIGSNVILRNSTVTNNSASVVAGGIAAGSAVTIINSIIARNSATTGPDCSGSMNSGGYNLLGNNSGCTFNETTGDKVGTAAVPINPRLRDLQDNGGSTFTHALMAGSPAINAGNPAAPGSGGNACLGTDQRGIARPDGARCDIGAYEGYVPWVPSPLVRTYTAKNTSSLPGTFLCDQTDPGCAAGDSHAKAAHKFALGTYDLYATRHLRDGIDGNGMVIISTVHYCQPGYACPFDNAFWNGDQMVYGGAHGYALADDVVAHELTHGMTQYESNLFYYYQSGAIDESFSDLWGEYYDQTNSQGNDSASVKWRIGEDISGLTNPVPLPAVGLRDMSNPPLFHDPDKISSTYYYEGTDDNGGVHFNSGVNNKAVFLMVDGGTFNGKTVTALDWGKTAAIYYEANTNLLTSGADYSDLYYSLQQACTNLIGKNGVLAGDCVQVKAALDAVEMNSQPASGFNTEAPLCPTAGTVAKIVFADDLENGTSNWTFTNGSNTRWQYDSPYGGYAQSGEHFLYADDLPAALTDARATLAGTAIPANAYLHFAQAYGFEYDANGYYDGGVLEYSTNGGSTWTDAGSLMQVNGYDAKIYSTYINPLKGRSAFVGSSHGYISTRLNLATLAGQTVGFRWRMGLDDVGSDWGWWVDNVKIYTCVGGKTISGNVGGPGVKLSYVEGGANKSVFSQANGNYSIQIPTGWSGTVTPLLVCHTFDPASRDYSSILANQTGQDYTQTYNPADGCTNVDVSIGGVVQGGYYAQPGEVLVKSYAGLQNGPVKVKSSDNSTLFASEGVVSGNSFNEVMGYPTNQLTTEYWFPWYDNIDMATWILVGNPSTTQTATADIYVGGVKRGSYAIPPNGRVTPRFNLQTGPVRVVSTNNLKLFTSERAVYKGAFNEVMGYPASQFTTEYWFPWYDNSSMATWILVGNPSTTSTAAVDIYVGGIKRGSYAIPKGGRITPRFNITPAGPVRVFSTNGVKIFSSERTIYGDSFNEVMGSPANQFTTEYWYPWYDNISMATWVLVGNPTTSTAAVDIYIGSVKQASYNIGPGKQINQRFPLNTGPVRVVSTNGVKVFSSERVLYGISFNEVMGYPGNQLTTEYWFPWYDSTSMSTDILVGRP
jgi:Zn-dependent metalloprotease